MCVLVLKLWLLDNGKNPNLTSLTLETSLIVLFLVVFFISVFH